MTNKIEKPRVLVTGSNGMLGQAIQKYLNNYDFDLYFINSGCYDLTREEDVMLMYQSVKPNRVIHLAAKVGGIFDNLRNPLDFLEKNILMSTLVTKWAHKYNVKRFTGMLSTCVYPNDINKYPLSEEDVFTGTPEITNFGYAYAKRVQGLQIEYYNKLNRNWNYLMPCNLYGIDHKPLDSLHFIPALIKKIQNAVANNEDSITLFGDGTPLRQFMYADDLAKIINIMVEKDIKVSCNVAVPWNLSIKEMADIVMKVMDANLNIEWDTTKPNGQHRRDASTTRFEGYYPDFKFTTLTEGVKQIISNE